MNAFFNTKDKLNYNKYIPSVASGPGKNLPNGLYWAAAGNSPIERARRSLAKDQAARRQTDHTPGQTAEKPLSENAPRKAEPPKKPEPPRRKETPPKQTPRPNRAKRGKARPGGRPKRTPVFTATLSGLFFSALILLAATGLYGAYCFSQGLPGDTNVRASTAIYCLAVFVGGFWASAVVKRQSLSPLIIIGCVYMLLSLLISWQLFDPASFKFLMIFEKMLLTAISLLLGYLLSLIPYLINKAFKKRRKPGRDL